MELIYRHKVDYEVNTHSLFDIINFNEIALLSLMRDAYAADPSLCRCPHCSEDVYALTLNNVPPRYIQASSLRMYSEVDAKVAHEQVKVAMDAALVKVKDRPNHG